MITTKHGSDLKWLKDDGHITASENGCDFTICKTSSCPPSKIPAAQRWTLEVCGPWYMCKCFPRLFDCYAAAERVLAAMPTLETPNE